MPGGALEPGGALSTAVGQAPRAAPAPTRQCCPSGCAFTWQSSACGCSSQPEPLQHGNHAPFTEHSSVLHAASRISARLTGERTAPCLPQVHPQQLHLHLSTIERLSPQFLLSFFQPTSPCSLSSQPLGTFPGARSIKGPQHSGQISRRQKSIRAGHPSPIYKTLGSLLALVSLQYIK